MLKSDSQTWERLLWTSGGLFNLKKCLYYVLAWTFDSEGKAKMTPATEILPTLSLTSGDAPGRVDVKHYNYDDAHQYLGGWLPTNMQMKTRDAALMEKRLDFS
jgi:hypothetical protein